MESGRIEPFRALPVHREAQPCLQPPLLGQIYTMYIDFPLDGNTPNPTLKSLKRRLVLENPLQTPPRLWRRLEARGACEAAILVLQARDFLELSGVLEAPVELLEGPGVHRSQGLWAPGWRPLQTRLRRARLSLKRSKKTIFSRWELRA